MCQVLDFVVTERLEAGELVEVLASASAKGPDIRAVATAARATSANVRAGALAALGAIGGAQAVAALVAACADPRAEEAAVAALAGLAPDDLPALAEGLRYPQARVRRAVVDALARRRDGHAAPVLAQALEDPARAVRLAAAHALRRLDLRAVRGQLEHVARSDDDAAVREAAQSALLG